MGRRRQIVAGALAGAAVAAAVWAGFLRPSSQAERSAPARGALLVAVGRRKGLPRISGRSLIPPPARLPLRGKDGRPALIDVWASWCVPCKEEAPMLAALARIYRGRVRFLGIDVEDTSGEAQGFVRRYRIPYPSIFDSAASTASQLGFFGLPTAYLIDRRGRIAATLVGKHSRAAFVSRLELLLRDPDAR